MKKEAELRGLLDSISRRPPPTVRLYFVSRRLKSETTRASRVMQKYTFHLHQLDIDEDLRRMFLDMMREQLEKIMADNDLSLAAYEIIDDDEPKLYTYQLQNKAMSFADVTKHQLMRGVDIPSVQDIGAFLGEHELWAFCLDVTPEKGDRFTTFTKTTPGRVAIDERENPERLLPSRVLRTLFNSTNSMLELLHGDTVNFDKRMDCLYRFKDDRFFIFHKKHFEKIVSLEEEYKESAGRVVDDLEASTMIVGLDAVKDELEGNPTIHRRLHKIAQAADYKKLDRTRVKKMIMTAKSFGLQLKIKSGKLHVEDRHDLDLVVRMLDDYFLESKQTGNKYGASVKKRWMAQG